MHAKAFWDFAARSLIEYERRHWLVLDWLDADLLVAANNQRQLEWHTFARQQNILLFFFAPKKIAVTLHVTSRVHSDFPIDSNFMFYVRTFSDLQQTSKRFDDGNVTSFSQLLFDVSRNQMIVGAR